MSAFHSFSLRNLTLWWKLNDSMLFMCIFHYYQLANISHKPLNSIIHIVHRPNFNFFIFYFNSFFGFPLQKCHRMKKAADTIYLSVQVKRFNWKKWKTDSKETSNKNQNRFSYCVCSILLDNYDCSNENSFRVEKNPVAIHHHTVNRNPYKGV